ncbi:hypothetical protein E3C22_10485 [Jiella endophytica]|uniref:Sulfotransferase domain-containing protein n=1 Tax=Jiella endophytica TaxID=2558362 RepID=A0A4Y8RIJ9_9HYPH|nr:sulfotransferase domain-containing protein [Jiella endophytica]TFF22879.1 hypothetical protein E3C22_10485 [Jiella endophytica]
MSARIPELFLIAGAQKAGTSWLYNRLSHHPEIVTAHRKEMHYFNAVHSSGRLGTLFKAEAIKALANQRLNDVAAYFQAQVQGHKSHGPVHQALRPMDDGWYIDAFRGHGRWAIDATPEYASLPDAGHEHIKRISRRQKILFVMREPTDRALSAVRYHFKTRNQDIRTADEASIAEVARNSFIVGMSRYLPTIAMLRKHYEPDDVMILVYEKIMSQPRRSLAQICRFLEIPRRYIDEIPDDVVERRDNATDRFDMPAAVVKMIADALEADTAVLVDRYPDARAFWQRSADQANEHPVRM